MEKVNFINDYDLVVEVFGRTSMPQKITEDYYYTLFESCEKLHLSFSEQFTTHFAERKEQNAEVTFVKSMRSVLTITLDDYIKVNDFINNDFGDFLDE